MFSFAELLLTSVVALLVLGPKRLLAMAYQLGIAMRRWHRLWQPIKQVIEQQARHNELSGNIERAAAAEQQQATTPTHRE